MSTLTFSSNKTVLAGKQGKLKTNSEGHYEIMVGAFNHPNNIGDIYPFTERVKKLFTKSTAITKLNNNQLYGEADHPDLNEFRSKTRTEQQAIALWIDRLSKVVSSNISHQILGVRWEKLGIKHNGKPVYGVYNVVNPINPILKSNLKDPNANTAFSVRSFINRTMEMGQFMCEAKDIITWDWVPTGGIDLATKYNTPSLESESKIYMESDSAIITTDVVRELERLEASSQLVGNESTQMFNSTMVKGLAGWREVPDLSSLVSRNW